MTWISMKLKQKQTPNQRKSNNWNNKLRLQEPAQPNADNLNLFSISY